MLKCHLDSAQDVDLAKVAHQQLLRALTQSPTPCISMAVDPESDLELRVETVKLLPKMALPLLTYMVGLLAQGRTLVVENYGPRLSVQEAAAYLNVSRRHVLKLTDAGLLPFHQIGTNLQIDLYDVVRYESNRRLRSRDALQSLVDLAEDGKMGY